MCFSDILMAKANFKGYYLLNAEGQKKKSSVCVRNLQNRMVLKHSETALGINTKMAALSTVSLVAQTAFDSPCPLHLEKHSYI